MYMELTVKDFLFNFQIKHLSVLLAGNLQLICSEENVVLPASVLKHHLLMKFRAGLFCSGNDYIPGMRTIFSIKVLSQMLLIWFGPGSMCNCVASIFPEPARTWVLT
jgi:hypothetical protein